MVLVNERKSITGVASSYNNFNNITKNHLQKATENRSDTLCQPPRRRGYEKSQRDHGKEIEKERHERWPRQQSGG